MSLLTPAEHSPKLAHYTDDDIVGAIMYLAPALNSGHNTCPYATKGCASKESGCLFGAGRGAMTMIQEARILKTQRFFADKAAFVATLAVEIATYERKAIRKGARCVIRLNGTSDIMWERIPCTLNGITYPNLMLAFPNVQFYDYTKIPNRNVPANYHLTFSLSENNDKHALAELARGRNVAVVLSADETLPETWSGYPVVEGDKHDYRFLDPQGGHIVALKAKGPAKKDTSGFVRPLDGTLDPSRTFVPFTLVR